MNVERTKHLWLLLLAITLVLAHAALRRGGDEPELFRGTLHYGGIHLGCGSSAVLATPEGGYCLRPANKAYAKPLFAPHAGSRVVVTGHRQDERRRRARWQLPTIVVIELQPDSTADSMGWFTAPQILPDTIIARTTYAGTVTRACGMAKRSAGELRSFNLALPFGWLAFGCGDVRIASFQHALTRPRGRRRRCGGRRPCWSFPT